MTIAVTCDECQNDFDVPDDNAGLHAKCARCGTLVEVPEDDGPKEPQPPPLPISLGASGFGAQRSSFAERKVLEDSRRLMAQKKGLGDSADELTLASDDGSSPAQREREKLEERLAKSAEALAAKPADSAPTPAAEHTDPNESKSKVRKIGVSTDKHLRGLLSSSKVAAADEADSEAAAAEPKPKRKLQPIRRPLSDDELAPWAQPLGDDGEPIPDLPEPKPKPKPRKPAPAKRPAAKAGAQPPAKRTQAGIRLGQDVGGYKLVRRLGDPKTSAVFLAEKEGEKFALKILPRKIIEASPTAKARFLRKARAVGDLRHENLVSMLEGGEDDVGYFMVMENVEGQPLQTFLDAKGGRVREDHAIDMMIPVIRALGYLHDKGLVHRALRPDHILVGDGVIKLTGLGLLRAGAEDEDADPDVDIARLTAKGVVAGTPEFSSPEQVRDLELDGRSDLFVVGTLLYLMITGKPPFEGVTPAQIMHRVASQEPTPIRERTDNISRASGMLISALLSKKPADRYPRAAELLRDLEAIRNADLEDGLPPWLAKRKKSSEGSFARIRSLTGGGGGEGPSRGFLIGAGAAGLLIIVIIIYLVAG